jgi:hypothetical protein
MITLLLALAAPARALRLPAEQLLAPEGSKAARQRVLRGALLAQQRCDKRDGLRGVCVCECGSGVCTCACTCACTCTCA